MILRWERIPSSSSNGVQAADSQTVVDSTALWKAGGWYHILLVTTLVRGPRKNVLRGGALRQG